MKTLFLLSFVVLTTVVSAQFPTDHIKRFWFGLFGPVYHSDTDLEVKFFKGNDTLSTILPAGVDYYVTDEQNEIFYIKLLNPIKIDIENDSVSVYVKDFIDYQRKECKNIQKKKYKFLKAQLESGKQPSYSNDTIVKQKSSKPTMQISKKEFVEINCTDYYDTIEMRKEQVLFYIESPEPYEKIFRQGITTGTLFLPIKIRPAITVDAVNYERDFTTDISMGPYIGYKYNVGSRYDQFVSGGLFAGPSLIRFNPGNSTDELETETNVLGFTWGLGLTFELNKFQIGVVGGYDYLSGENAKTWIYDKELWFSIGIGFEFFKQE
jgi:hypothetical protein